MLLAIIYSSAEPHNGEDGWMLLDTVSEPGYTYEGADDKRFFRIKTLKEDVDPE